MVSNSGKSTIDLNGTRGLQNIKVVTEVFTSIKTMYKPTEILIEQEPSFNPNPSSEQKMLIGRNGNSFLKHL